MTHEIPKLVEPRAAADRPLAIPRQIVQTFETAEVPDRMHRAAMSWVERNPTFSYRFFDAEDRRAFIAKHFDARTLEAYDRIEGGAFRADFWRYCVLFVEGGVYADLDTICESDLEALLTSGDDFITVRAGNLDWALFNAFICAAPGHPFIERAIARASDMIHRWRPGTPFEGYTITGPATLGQAVNEALGRKAKQAHEIGTHEAEGHRYRILRKELSAPRRVVDGDRVVLLTEYPEYREDLSAAGQVHWQDTMRAKGSLRGRLRRRLGRLIRRVT